jgi:hypothetical protein
MAVFSLFLASSSVMHLGNQFPLKEVEHSINHNLYALDMTAPLAVPPPLPPLQGLHTLTL